MSQGPPTTAPETTEPEPRGGTRFPLIPEPRVFFPSAGLVVVFVLATVIWPTKMNDWIGDANSGVVDNLGWWYIAIVTGFVFYAIWLALSPMGNIKLGKDDEDPEYRVWSWFAMLFAAGMGIGLVFFGVAEPLAFLGDPPPGVNVPDAAGTTGGNAEIARAAMDRTFLHWGLHAWAIYVVVGLALAYAVHRKDRPVSLRWALEPILGKRVLGFWGDVIDVIAVLGTLFGVATSLGLGVSQISGGLQHLGVVDDAGEGLKVLLIVVITAIALTSVVTGIDKGIKWLSNFNLSLAGVLLITVLLLGPTVFILGDFVTQIGSYITNFFNLSFDAMPFQGEEGQTFLAGWTTFYWGWWMSWAPFVGVFIARISRGRTVREFILGVLLVPTLMTFLWFSVLGGSAIHHELFGDGGLLTPFEKADGSTAFTPDYDLALFQFLDTLPASTVLGVAAIILIVVFFVTSSDSGSFVVDMLSSGGQKTPPVWSRAFWATMEGAIAAALLLAGSGGLDALKTMAILLAAPFSVIMVLMVVATSKALLGEQRAIRRRREKWLREEVAKEVASEVADQTNNRPG
jgi:choline/glycine/proline betaine transport protein